MDPILCLNTTVTTPSNPVVVDKERMIEFKMENQLIITL